ncbi:uncharacterized protein sparcl2 [Silurus meridionalis]|uniref:uncharacterized protein sparcl2 n=1 Tax=Silurus meridionalis TaxID=175797 RepID=UPI001EEAEFC1|nr:uncharacterized protein sparcl2 [Silurus meridionalis]
MMIIQMFRHNQFHLLTLLMTICLHVTLGVRAQYKQRQMDSELKPYVGRVDAAFLCELMKCYSPVGSQCQVVKNEDILIPQCVCPTTCPQQVAPVCSVVGKTYISECLLHKEACRKKRRIERHTMDHVWRLECVQSRSWVSSLTGCLTGFL